MQRNGFIFVFGLLAAAAPGLAATISVQPPSATFALGATVNLTVDVSGATDLYGYQFDLGFDPTILEAISVSEGPFLATGGSTIFLPGLIDNTGGTISANADTLQTAVAGVSGNGTLLNVSFLATGAGSTDIEVFNLIALNSFGQGLTFTTSSSSVTVSGVPEPSAAMLLVFGAIFLWAVPSIAAQRLYGVDQRRAPRREVGGR